jgi:tetratricopeptide (TPR) repeat protein
MARRRLNKKVALMGGMVFLLLAMLAVFVILRLNRDAAPLIAAGDAAWGAKDYPTARENYGRAYALVEAPEMKVGLLFKLSDVYRETGQWDKVLACWETIVTTDPQNVKAYLGRLQYAYILADSLGSAGRGVSEYWDEVLTQARRTLPVVANAGLLDARREEWEPPLGTVKDRGWSRGTPRLGPHLWFVKGRAAMELAAMGAVPHPDELLQEAQTDLEEARKLDAGNAQIYHYLAEVFVVRGKIAASAGNRVEQAAAEKQADEILAEGVRVADGVPEAHIHLLARKLSAVQGETVSAARERMGELESQYDALTQRFASSPQAHAARAQFYSFFAAYLDTASALDKLDKAIAASRQAGALDPENVEYAILTAGYQYRKYSTYRDAEALQASIELARKSLGSPEAQDTPGPTQTARRVNRFSLCSILARGCIERVLSLSPSDPAKTDLLARAEEAVRQIGQIQGAGENPEILKWQGMLDLAKGRTGKAVKSLYAAYRQIKAANPPEQRDPHLSLTLATIFKDTAETGAVIDFLGTAMSSGIIHTRPDALLDYGDALMRAGSYDVVTNIVNSFEERFGENDRSRVLRVRALIAKGFISEAEVAVARLKPDDPATLSLNLELVRTKTTQLLTAIYQEQVGRESSDTVENMTAELRDHHRREAELTRQLLQIDPNAVEERHVVRLCESLVERGDPDTVRAVVDAYLGRSPDSPSGLFYQGLLSEPDPQKCSEARRKEIQEQRLRSIRDPLRQALELGAFYRQTERLDQAQAQWRSVLNATTAQADRDIPAYLTIRNISPRHLAVGYLFDLARHRENWKLAEEMVSLARRENLDDCGGYLYAARLAFARGQHDAALTSLDECLKERPVFSYGYLLRGNVKASLGRERESVEDIREASRLNPMDPVVAKSLANALYARNGKLGAGASSEQQLEARQALERAIHLNPRDAGLLSVYADLIADSDPMKAIAIRQTIQANAPSVQNAVLLGKLATQTAQREIDETKRALFLKVAEAAFEQAQGMEPNNQFMLDSYAAYLRATGQTDKARDLLVESKDSRLLWRHYFRVRDFAQAGRLLAEMYTQGDMRTDAVKGLLLIAEETGDRQGVKKYSEELISLEDNAGNRFAQLRAYLNVGLVSEAELKLQSLKEKYPKESNLSLLEAQVAKRQGQLRRAMDLIARGLESNQQNPAAWRLRGEIFLLMGDEEQAILDFRKSRELQDDPATTLALAKAYLWIGRNDDAVAELLRAKEQPQAPLEVVTLLEATYRKLGRNDALEQLYTQALAESPDSVFWLNRAGAFAIDRKRYGQAEQLFEKAARLRRQTLAGQKAAGAGPDGEYSAALDGYLRALLLGAGDPAAAGGIAGSEKLDRVFQEGGKYVETPYAPVAFFRMAEARKMQGDIDAARDYARKAADKAWSNERLAVEVLLRVYLLLGEEEASAYCRRRLAAEPDSLAANFVLFNLAKIQDKYDESIPYIDQCIESAGPDTEAGVEYTLRKADLLATAYKRTSDKRRLERAVEVYESLRAKMPKNSSVLNNLAYMLAQNDQSLDKALEYAGTAVRQSPDVASHQDTYAYVLYKNGRYAEAVEAMTAAIQQYEISGTASAEVYEHLGMIQEALEQKAKALAAYRRALEAGGDSTPAAVQQRIRSAIQRLQ